MLLNLQKFHIKGPSRVLKPPPFNDPRTHLYLNMNFNRQNCILINQVKWKDVKKSIFLGFLLLRGNT